MYEIKVLFCSVHSISTSVLLSHETPTGTSRLSGEQYMTSCHLAKLHLVYISKPALRLFIWTGVHLTRESHGPALTLTIMPPKADSHHISIDIVPSLPSHIPLTSFGWPRPSTVKAFTRERIQAATDAGTHLVPKKDTVFDISYSKAEKALLENIDSGNGCRKKCHQVIKKYVQTFSSQNSASGISSHIFKVVYVIHLGAIKASLPNRPIVPFGVSYNGVILVLMTR